MLIRPIESTDNKAIATIIRTSLESLGLDKPGTAYFDPQLDDLHEFYSGREAAEYWVVEDNGEVVGGMGIAPFSDGIAELQKLYLSEDAQGKGYAKALVETGLKFASQYYDKVYLETTTDLSAACRLYEKYGFELLDIPLPGSDHGAMNAWYLRSL